MSSCAPFLPLPPPSPLLVCFTASHPSLSSGHSSCPLRHFRPLIATPGPGRRRDDIRFPPERSEWRVGALEHARAQLGANRRLGRGLSFHPYSHHRVGPRRVCHRALSFPGKQTRAHKRPKSPPPPQPNSTCMSNVAAWVLGVERRGVLTSSTKGGVVSSSLEMGGVLSSSYDRGGVLMLSLDSDGW